MSPRQDKDPVLRDFAAIAVVAALAALAASGCRRADQQQAAAAPPPPSVLAPEDVVRVVRSSIQTGPRIAGTLVARERSVVRAETGGAVVHVGPELGERVQRGVLLVRIAAKALSDTLRSAQAAVTAAETQVELARNEVERTTALVGAGAVAARDLERARGQVAAAEASLGQARAQLALARSQLGDATVRSPITGVVAQRGVRQGDVVAPGTLLYEIIDPSTMRLEAAVPADALGLLAIGKPVVFEVRGYPAQTFTGTLARIAPAADPATRQIPILVDLPNPEGQLVAGLFADGRVAATSKEALLVPLPSIDESTDQPSVLRVRNDTIERVTVSLGLRDEARELVEVTSGLAAGDLLLRRTARDLTPGTRVVVPAANAER